jgi:hypothetical protein
MWRTIRQIFRRVGGKLYNLSFRYIELYENRFEAAVAASEILLIALGLWLWFRLHQHPGGSPTLPSWEMPLKGAESIVFLLLLLLSFSRLFVAWRRTRLGYSYSKLVRMINDRQPEPIKPLYEHIKGIGWGYALGLQPEWPGRQRAIAKRIAHQTAGLLSERAWFLRDERWRAREEESLNEWFKAFPPSLWKLPATEEGQAAEGSRAGGYFSVIVPMTRESARSIRKGWRATDLAEIDPKAAQVFRAGGSEPARPVDQVELLAYLHIYVPPVWRKDRDDARLLAASIQHLAFLLRGFYGSREGCDKFWNFTLLCESSNRAMNRVMERLGLTRVERERDGSLTQAREARSYAGFLLFELKVEQGQGNNPQANDFLVTLRNLVFSCAKPELADAPGEVSDG